MLFRHHCCCSTLWQQELRRTNSCIGSGQLSCLPSSGCGLCPCRHCKQWFTWLIPFFFWCHRQRISSCILPPNMYAFASGWYWFWEGTNWERKRWKWCVLQGHMAIKRRNCRGKLKKIALIYIVQNVFTEYRMHLISYYGWIIIFTRLSNRVCCLTCLGAHMKQSHRATQCGTSCPFQKQNASHGTPTPPIFMIPHSSRI